MMQRTIIRAGAGAWQQASRRRFISTARSYSQYQRKATWVGAGLLTAGVSSMILSSPLALDAKKDQKAEEAVKTAVTTEDKPKTAPEAAGSDGSEPAAPEEEKGQQAAYNPETGEINWDCPCLGGMADGPCGEEFKEAFSCFIFSEAEPKGIDCIEKFKNMQNCFRKYPDVYSEELRDDEEEAVVETETTLVSDGKAEILVEETTITESSPEFVAEPQATLEVSEPVSEAK